MLRHIFIGSSLIVCLLLNTAYADGNRHHRKSSAVLSFVTLATGAQEVTNPAGGVSSDRVASATAHFDSGLRRVFVQVRLNDSSNVIAAHFHCARAGANGPVIFGLISPGMLGLENNRIQGTLTNADATGADCSATIGRPVNNIASLALAMRDGLIYLNIHSTTNPAGEIRGQMLELD